METAHARERVCGVELKDPRTLLDLFLEAASALDVQANTALVDPVYALLELAEKKCFGELDDISSGTQYVFNEPSGEVDTAVDPHVEFDSLLLSHGTGMVDTYSPAALSNLRLDRHPVSSPFRCLLCADHFDSEPWCVYDRKNMDGSWDVFHNFCSVGCAARFLSEVNEPGRQEEWKVNLSVVARHRLGIPITKHIPISPPIACRIDYGGSMSIDDWIVASGRGMTRSTAQASNTVSDYCRGPFVYGRAATCTTTTTDGRGKNPGDATLRWIKEFKEPNYAVSVAENDPTPKPGVYGTRSVPMGLQAKELCNEAPSTIYAPIYAGQEENKGEPEGKCMLPDTVIVPTSEQPAVDRTDTILAQVIAAGNKPKRAAKKSRGGQDVTGDPDGDEEMAASVPDESTFTDGTSKSHQSRPGPRKQKSAAATSKPSTRVRKKTKRKRLVL